MTRNKRIKNKRTRKQNGSGWKNWFSSTPPVAPVEVSPVYPSAVASAPVASKLTELEKEQRAMALEESQKTPITYMLIRHALSCNNLLKEQKMNVVSKYLNGDADPSLTLYGIKSLLNLNRETPHFSGTVFVSVLIRTWQSAILEFYKKTNTLGVDLNLIVAPFIKEAGSSSENMPLPHEDQINKMNLFIKTLITDLGIKNLPSIYVTTKNDTKIQLYDKITKTIKGGACTTLDQYIEDVAVRSIKPTVIYDTELRSKPIYVNFKNIRTDLFTFYYGENALLNFNSWYRLYYTDPHVFIVCHSNLMQSILPTLIGQLSDDSVFKHNSWAFTVVNENNRFGNLTVFTGVPKPTNAKSMCNELEPLCFKETPNTITSDQLASNQLKLPKKQIKYTKPSYGKLPIQDLPTHEQYTQTERPNIQDLAQVPNLVEPKGFQSEPINDPVKEPELLKEPERIKEPEPAQVEPDTKTPKKSFPTYTCATSPIIYSTGPYTFGSKTVASTEILTLLGMSKSGIAAKMAYSLISNTKSNPILDLYTEFNTTLDAFEVSGNEQSIIDLLTRHSALIQNHYIGLMFISPVVMKFILDGSDTMNKGLSAFNITLKEIYSLFEKIQKLYSNPTIYNVMVTILLKHSNALYYHSNTDTYKTLLDLIIGYLLSAIPTNENMKKIYVSLVQKYDHSQSDEDLYNQIKYQKSLYAAEHELIEKYVGNDQLTTTLKFIVHLVHCGAMFSENVQGTGYFSKNTHKFIVMNTPEIKGKGNIDPFKYIKKEISNYCSPSYDGYSIYNTTIDTVLLKILVTLTPSEYNGGNTKKNKKYKKRTHFAR